MKEVTVLMSTYNGEKYLREQIESILSQRNVVVHLLVRDDGSTDSTIDILNEYKNKGCLNLIQSSNIGWRKSFMELVNSAPDSDFYAFCDQDDIWLPNKLYVAIETILKENYHRTPILYGSNLYYYKNGEVKGKVDLNTKFTKQSCLIRALTCGCTFVFNKKLCDLLKGNPPNYVEAHDSWIFMVAMYLGKVLYDPNAYILYRQHDNNQIGLKTSFFERYKRFVRTINKDGKENAKRKSAEEFLRIYKKLLTEEDIKYISKFAYYNKSIMSRIKLICDNRYTTGKIINDCLLKIKIITNKI